eukprot:TRINITY_DN1126_c1_g1_i1.p2 TRINITY_DN1126_c1_g1~~TRINITY_DN1126_c1_g1_i1.p2  ORF type:complete len:150 (-),score=41.14 TRINITY_DN1126_c1_g1_i1:619-1068(-)
MDWVLTNRFLLFIVAFATTGCADFSTAVAATTSSRNNSSATGHPPPSERGVVDDVPWWAWVVVAGGVAIGVLIVVAVAVSHRRHKAAALRRRRGHGSRFGSHGEDMPLAFNIDADDYDVADDFPTASARDIRADSMMPAPRIVPSTTLR